MATRFCRFLWFGHGGLELCMNTNSGGVVHVGGYNGRHKRKSKLCTMSSRYLGGARGCSSLTLASTVTAHVRCGT
jgi:hypothetical protein